MLCKKTFLKILLLLFFICFSLVYLYAQNLEVYLNEEWGVSFKYPGEWVITEFTEDNDGYNGVAVSEIPLYQGQIVRGAAFGFMITNWAYLGFSDIDAFIESVRQANDISEVFGKYINDIECVFFSIENHYEDIFGEVYIHESEGIAYIINIVYKTKPEIDLGDYQEIINNILNSIIIFEPLAGEDTAE